MKSTVTKMFASLTLGQTELALPVALLQEVVNVPDKITPVPLAPPFLTGLFHLRGAVIPIVDMAKFLNLEPAPEACNRKIAIVLCGQIRAGLLFDSTSEILHVRDEDIATMTNDREDHRSVVKSILKLEGGNRLVDVIDPVQLIQIGNLPELMAKTQKAEAEVTKKKSKRVQCIIFQSGQMEFALKIEAIREIIRVPEIRKSVLSQESCLGMVNLRGSIVPIIDFQQFLKASATAATITESCRIIILKIQNAQIGFLVDNVNNIAHFFEDEILPLPLFQQERTDMMEGVLPHQEGSGVVLLKGQNILSDTEVLRITQGHSSLYAADGADQRRQTDKKSGERRAYLSFRLEYTLSTRLSDIEEIAVVSENLACPPGFPKYVAGILKMRNDVITVIDLRQFYGMKPATEIVNSRLLVVKGQKNKYGLLVDAVESIDTIDEKQKIQIPMVLARDVADTLQGHMKEVIETTDLQGNKKTFMVLEMPELLKNLEKLAA